MNESTSYRFNILYSLYLPRFHGSVDQSVILSNFLSTPYMREMRHEAYANFHFKHPHQFKASHEKIKLFVGTSEHLLNNLFVTQTFF